VYTTTGQAAWSEVTFGTIVSFQHLFGVGCMAWALHTGDSSWFRFAIASEISYELNDLIYIFLKLGRHNNIPAMVACLLTMHHALGLGLGVPCALWFSENVAVQKFSLSLLFSGAMLACSLAFQYFNNRKTIGGCLIMLTLNIGHGVEFAFMRFVYPFIVSDYADVYALVSEQTSLQYWSFVAAMVCMTFFSLLVTLINVDRNIKNWKEYTRLKFKLARQARIEAANTVVTPIFTHDMLQDKYGDALGKFRARASPRQRLFGLLALIRAKNRIVRLVADRKMNMSSYTALGPTKKTQ